MARLENLFSWSVSRARLFQDCRRKYWLNYYGSWEGWERDAAHEVREAYQQKKLTTRPMWIGTVVHEAAERALQALEWRVPEVEETTGWAVQKARKDIEVSLSEGYRRRPAKIVAFSEHYYGLSGADASWQEELGEIERQVRGLFSNPVFLRMLAVPERILQVEQMIRVELEGCPVWIVMDVLMDDGQEGVVIVDWKTGRSQDEERISQQLGVYGLYARDHLGLPSERIKALHVDLRARSHKSHPITEEQLANAAAWVARSSAEMRSCLVDEAENLARKEDFPLLPEGSPACETCQFRRSCQRE